MVLKSAASMAFGLVTAAVLTLESCFPNLHPGDWLDALSRQVENHIIRFAELDEKAEEKTYTIAPDAKAPAPNPDNYGTTTDPQKLRRVISKAKDLLDGQQLYFSTDAALFPGSEITYYRDATILAITWKEEIASTSVFGTTSYTFSEIKIADPSQFRRYLSGGYASEEFRTTSQMAALTNAVAACAGDFYAYRDPGVVVADGAVLRANWGVPDNCYIRQNGDILMQQNQNVKDIPDFVKENEISFSLSFGPILVKDGQTVPIGEYPLGEIKKYDTRAALCQMDELHYLLVTANVEPEAWHTITIWEFQKQIASTGCRQAYTIDGGQTATIVTNNQVINHVNYGPERSISDMIYFATAVPEDSWK